MTWNDARLLRCCDVYAMYATYYSFKIEEPAVHALSQQSKQIIRLPLHHDETFRSFVVLLLPNMIFECIFIRQCVAKTSSLKYSFGCTVLSLQDFNIAQHTHEVSENGHKLMIVYILKWTATIDSLRELLLD